MRHERNPQPAQKKFSEIKKLRPLSGSGGSEETKVLTKRSKVQLGPRLAAQTGHRFLVPPLRYLKILLAVFFVAAAAYGISIWNHAAPATSGIPNGPQVLGAQQTDQPGYYFYSAAPTDSLFSISEKFQVNWETIASLNNLTEPFAITAGQKIKLPANAQTRQQQYFDNLKNKLYVVESGDSFVSIAQKLDVSVNDLMRANPQLKTVDLLHVGQVLHLP